MSSIDLIQWVSVNTVVEDSGGLGELVRNFRIRPSLLIAQAISFFLVLLVLKKFAFGPVMTILAERRNRIQEGEAKLAEIEKRLADSEVQTQELLAKANLDAQRLIQEAKQASEVLAKQRSHEAINSAKEIIEKARVATETDRDKMTDNLRKEFGQLVAQLTAKVTGKILDDKDKKRLQKEALASLEE